MAIYLFIILLIASTLNVTEIGYVAAFLEQKFILKKVLFRFVVCSAIVVALMCLGGLLGKFGLQFLESYLNNWFAASLLFVLSLKSAYDAVKLAPSKRAINPTFFGGLLSSTTFVAINAFIYMLALGFLQMPIFPIVLLTIPMFLVALLIVGIVGIRQQKIPRIQSEWILSAISLLCSLIIIYNK